MFPNGGALSCEWLLSLSRARTLTTAPFNQSRYTVLVGDPPHREVAVGALVCRKNQATTLRKLLPRAW